MGGFPESPSELAGYGSLLQSGWVLAAVTVVPIPRPVALADYLERPRNVSASVS